MKEFEMWGKQFQYEKLMAEKFEKGACAFKVVDADGDTSYWVVVPATLQKQVDGEVINTPNDGHLSAVCMSEQDALMIASSVCIAATVADMEQKSVRKALAETTERLAKEVGFDIEKLKVEVERLKAEGKTRDEIAAILKPRMNEFRRPDAKSGDEQKGGEW